MRNKRDEMWLEIDSILNKSKTDLQEIDNILKKIKKEAFAEFRQRFKQSSEKIVN